MEQETNSFRVPSRPILKCLDDGTFFRLTSRCHRTKRREASRKGKRDGVERHQEGRLKSSSSKERISRSEASSNFHPNRPLPTWSISERFDATLPVVTVSKSKDRSLLFSRNRCAFSPRRTNVVLQGQRDQRGFFLSSSKRRRTRSSRIRFFLRRTTKAHARWRRKQAKTKTMASLRETSEGWNPIPGW